MYVLAAKGDEIVTIAPEEEIVADNLAMDAESDEAEEVNSDEDGSEAFDNMEDDIDESEFEPDVEEVEVDDDDWDLEDDDITDEFDDGDLIDENGDKG